MRITATSTGNLAGVAAELERAAKRAQADAARAVGKQARKIILDDVRRARGNLRMMGGRLGVKTEIDATAISSTVTLRAKPAGPWAIVTSGTRAYDITPRRREVLAAGVGDVIGEHAHRRASTGRDYWTAATDRLEGKLDPIVEDIVDDAFEAAG